MKTLAQRLNRLAWTPATAIETVIAVFSIVAGLILFAFAGAYLAGGIVTSPSIFTNFSEFSGPLIFGATYFAGGVLTCYGLKKGNYFVEDWGLLLTFFSLSLTWLLTILINGLVPLSWVTVLFMSIISGIVYLHRRLAG